VYSIKHGNFVAVLKKLRIFFVVSIHLYLILIKLLECEKSEKDEFGLQFTEIVLWANYIM
jgi:hypothetical protein